MARKADKQNLGPTLAELLFGVPVLPSGADPDREGLRAELRGLLGDLPDREPALCQRCQKMMRGPLCPHCGEWQAGYPYLH